MNKLQKILTTTAVGLTLTSASFASDLIKWKTDTEDQRVKLDTTSTEGQSSVGSWNPTPFYRESVEYYLLCDNRQKEDYFGNALIDFFNVKMNGENNVTDYQITINQDTNLDGIMDYQAIYSLNNLLTENGGELSLTPFFIPGKNQDYIGQMSITAVPEPTAMALAGFGCIASLILSRLKVPKMKPLDYSLLDSIDFPKKK
jgi:hypothetical protein